jgi:hypothetical protein
MVNMKRYYTFPTTVMVLGICQASISNFEANAYPSYVRIPLHKCLVITQMFAYNMHHNIRAPIHEMISTPLIQPKTHTKPPVKKCTREGEKYQ